MKSEDLINKITQEYRSLIELSSPSDIELNRIEKILELAIYDTELNELISQVDEQVASESNLLGNDNFDCFSINSTSLDEEERSSITSKSHFLEKDKKHDIQKSENNNNVVLFPRSTIPHKTKKRLFYKYDVRPVISSFVAGGVIVLIGVYGLYNLLGEKKVAASKKQAVEFTVEPAINHRSNVETLSCNISANPSSEAMQKYYESLSELEKQVFQQQLHPLEIKMQVRKLQKQAETKQKQAEEYQRYAELNKMQAEAQKQFDIAQNWQTKAQNSLAKSKQWLCLSRQPLTFL